MCSPLQCAPFIHPFSFNFFFRMCFSLSLVVIFASSSFFRLLVWFFSSSLVGILAGTFFFFQVSVEIIYCNLVMFPMCECSNEANGHPFYLEYVCTIYYNMTKTRAQLNPPSGRRRWETRERVRETATKFVGKNIYKWKYVCFESAVSSRVMNFIFNQRAHMILSRLWYHFHMVRWNKKKNKKRRKRKRRRERGGGGRGSEGGKKAVKEETSCAKVSELGILCRKRKTRTNFVFLLFKKKSFLWSTAAFKKHLLFRVFLFHGQCHCLQDSWEVSPKCKTFAKYKWVWTGQERREKRRMNESDKVKVKNVTTTAQ